MAAIKKCCVTVGAVLINVIYFSLGLLAKTRSFCFVFSELSNLASVRFHCLSFFFKQKECAYFFLWIVKESLYEVNIKLYDAVHEVIGNGNSLTFLCFKGIFILLSRESDQSAVTISLRNRRSPVYHTNLGESR